MVLCGNCLRHGHWTEMTKVQFALPELYPDAHFPKHSNYKPLENTLNFTARECPVCHYQSPLEGWYNWGQRVKMTKRRWNVIEEKDSAYPENMVF